MAGREQLDNLIFVINCNLQRLDGPVRGNGKIIQELEGAFRGAGWNVIKVIWGTDWDPLLARDTDGLLLKRMEECVDGEYQDFKAKNGAYVREHFFGKYPKLQAMVADMYRRRHLALTRGGHDPHKVYAAYSAAVSHRGPAHRDPRQDGQGLRHGRGGRRPEHHPSAEEDGRGAAAGVPRPLRASRSPTSSWRKCRSTASAEDSAEAQYLRERRAALGGYAVRSDGSKSATLEVPTLAAFESQLKATEGREISTTMAFVRILNMLLRDKAIGKRVVPIVPDESAHLRHGGHVPPVRHLQPGRPALPAGGRRPADVLPRGQEGPDPAGGHQRGRRDVLLDRRRDRYSTNNLPMIPFYIYYSMFGFQRIGDLAWAAGDMRARGFLLGGTAGRTTLNGEGLQHEDGHCHILSSTDPELRQLRPDLRYEVAVIIQDGLRRMYAGAGGRLLLHHR